MEAVLKAAGAAITASLLALVIRKNSPEIALAVIAASVIFIAAVSRSAMIGFRDFVLLLTEKGELDAASVSVIVKTLGIALTVRISSDICHDAGQTAASSAIELCGAAVSLYLALPLMESVLDAIEELL